jgi:hypothetical protein
LNNNTYISVIGPGDIFVDPSLSASWVLYSSSGAQGSTGAQGDTGSASVSYLGGNNPYAYGTTGSAGQYLATTTLATTATAVYEVGPVTTLGTTKLMIMANVSFIHKTYSVIITVGRATTSGASIANSTNIVSDAAMWTNPPATSFYMAASAGVAAADTKPSNVSGFAIDTPGAGTFYYTIWMTSSTSATYEDMTAVLSVLSILP